MWPALVAHVTFLLDNTVVEGPDKVWDLIVDFNFCVYSTGLIKQTNNKKNLCTSFVHDLNINPSINIFKCILH